MRDASNHLCRTTFEDSFTTSLSIQFCSNHNIQSVDVLSNSFQLFFFVGIGVRIRAILRRIKKRLTGVSKNLSSDSRIKYGIIKEEGLLSCLHLEVEFFESLVDPHTLDVTEESNDDRQL